jgi:phosphoribosyl 1,2-cyclic phosphodiesterase
VGGGSPIVKICVLASSSAGNATFVRAGQTRLLIDAGLSRRELAARLAGIGENAAELDGILITHEHTDHVSGLATIARHLRKPVYLTLRTAPQLEWGEFQPSIETFQAGSCFDIGDIAVTSFTIPHDAVDPVGFVLRAEGIQIGIVTDLGYIPDSVKWHLRRSHVLILESNHDVDMLKVGPYPWAVKQRVLSRKGHLSNDMASDYIKFDLPDEMQTLILGHLSENNNHPAIVEMIAQQALAERGLTPHLVVAEPRRQVQSFQF